jgi:hypothetical protein
MGPDAHPGLSGRRAPPRYRFSRYFDLRQRHCGKQRCGCSHVRWYRAACHAVAYLLVCARAMRKLRSHFLIDFPFNFSSIQEKGPLAITNTQASDLEFRFVTLLLSCFNESGNRSAGSKIGPTTISCGALAILHNQRHNILHVIEHI